MTASLNLSQTLDATHLPDGQIDWTRTLVDQFVMLLDSLTADERGLYQQIWKQIAVRHDPIPLRQFGQIHRNSPPPEQTIANLSERKLVWYDRDLKAILQCPPFSILHTPHHVKAFGWERAHAVSALDIPSTLLIYGPNVWLDVQTACPRSGEMISFQIKMRQDHTLEWQAPPDSEAWRMWIPLADPPAADAYGELHELRSRIHIFYTQNDLDTHRHYQSYSGGIVYTLDQAMYLGNALLHCYASTL
jgi:hypothetical protein